MTESGSDKSGSGRLSAAAATSDANDATTAWGSAQVGILEWFRVGEHERVERVCESLRRLGVEHLRTGVSWADWATGEASEWYDWLLPRLHEHFDVLPCVLYTPPSEGVAPKASSPPRRPKAYADFLDLFLTRYGRNFEYVELWNEPNNVSEWDWTLDTDWLVFCEMVGGAAYWARYRGVKTVLGGMSPADPNWLRMMGQRGVLDYIDVVGIHGFPGTWEATWAGWDSYVESVQRVLDDLGCGARVWITETGFSTWQHDEHRQLLHFLDATRAPVDRMYWYSAEDLAAERETVDGFHTDEREYHFGICRVDGVPKLLGRIWAEGGIDGVRALASTTTQPRVRPASAAARRSRGPVIVGGAGFIGTNMAERLLSDGERATIVDNLSRPGVERNLRWLRARHGDRLGVEIADVRDRFGLRRALADASLVFHFAAQVAVTTSLDDPVHDFEVNARGTLNVLEEIRRLDAPPPLLFTSTNKVYGSLPDVELAIRDGRYWPTDGALAARGVGETRAPSFCSPYGCSKGAADQYVLDYAHSFGLPATLFRMSCIYGPHQVGNEDQGWVAHFLISALRGDPITIYGDGRQVRDVLFVDDLIDAMLLATRRIDVTRGRAFNIGGGPGNTLSLLELTDLIYELSGRRPGRAHGPWRMGDQRYYVSDIGLLERTTGWRPRVTVRDGVERLYRWLSDQRSPRLVSSSEVLQAAAR